MKSCSLGEQFKQGDRIAYNDGRPGHTNACATVLAVDSNGMSVQFDDRADTNYIAFADHRWMDSIELAEQ